MAIDSETALLFTREDGSLAEHFRFVANPTFDSDKNRSQTEAGQSTCNRIIRVIMGVILYISVISFITCAAQGCLDHSVTGVDARICEQLCPESRKITTYAGLIVGALGVMVSSLSL